METCRDKGLSEMEFLADRAIFPFDFFFLVIKPFHKIFNFLLVRYKILELVAIFLGHGRMDIVVSMIGSHVFRGILEIVEQVIDGGQFQYIEIVFDVINLECL